MTYAGDYSIIESAAGAGFAHFFRLNSVYDPDATGVGSSASGYNTWSALFRAYKVRKVTVRVQGTANPASGSFAQLLLLPVAQNPTVPSTPAYWLGMPGAVVHSLAPNANGGPTLVEVVQTFDNARVARVTNAQYDDEADFSGLTGSNPTRQNYVAVAIRGIASGSTVTLNFAIQITYEVEWFNPVPIQA